MKRSARSAIAAETVRVVEQGWYEHDGVRVDIGASFQACLEKTRLYESAETHAVRDTELRAQRPTFATEVEVVNETTLAGLARLATATDAPIGVLNFASAKNPGGGFLNGSEAQEESLARSSALHASQIRAFSFYETHRALDSCLYTDAMIFSPDCPVIRDDSGRFLTKPLAASFITSPAPNAGATARNNPSEFARIPEVLRSRSELVLAVAASHGIVDLVLGAWGCGVFRNDPAMVARAFADHLRGVWRGRFRRVVFSVLDTSDSKATYTAFAAALASHSH